MSEAGMAGRQFGFWDVEHRLRELSAQGDPLEKLAATVDFEIFRPELVTALGRRDRSRGGRPAFDPVLKFRMLVLQAMHGLSLAQTEFLVADRLSWMRFCHLGPGDAVPDANTLWDFREALIAALLTGIAASPWIRAALRYGAIALVVLLFLLSLRRSGERAGHLAERLETS